jgi:hypothetical protein
MDRFWGKPAFLPEEITVVLNVRAIMKHPHISGSIVHPLLENPRPCHKVSFTEN